MYQHFKLHMTQYNCARRYYTMLSCSYTTMQSNIHGHHLYHNPVMYPGILFGRGGGFNKCSWGQDRETGDLGAVAT